MLRIRKHSTDFTATPPRFCSELKGKKCTAEDSDLRASKFMPNCSAQKKFEGLVLHSAI